MPFSTYEADMMGNARIDLKGPIICGSWTTLDLVYTAGHFGIDDLGGIKVSIRSASDETPPQFDDPTAPGYTTVTASNGARLDVSYRKNSNIRPWGNTLYIKCLNFMSEGDTINIKWGDRSGGSPGARMQTFREYAHEYRFHVDAFATYDFVVLPDEKQPKIELIPGPAARHVAILPSLRKTGDSFTLGLKAEDIWGNPTSADKGHYQLVPSRPVEGLPKTISMADSSDGILKINGLRVKDAGDLTITMLNKGGAVMARSNQLRSDDRLPYRHFWSDMHGQSGETVGTNTARDYFTFGRDKAMIDICGHQGNDFQITDQFWAELNELTAEFNDPGQFLAIPGYEWSGNTSVGGDHNVWFRSEGRPIRRAQRSLVTENSSSENDCFDARALFENLKHEDALVVAHVGGRYANISFAHDAKLEPSVEVHSAWGTFEWIFDDAIKAGYKVGIVAASDGHKGRVGASYPGAGKFGSLGGLTCHLMEHLERDALFTAFRRRRHFATTGCRPFIDLRIDDLKDALCWISDDHHEMVQSAFIGDIISCANDMFKLRFDVAAHAGIERIEIKDGLELVQQYLTDFNARKTGHRFRVQCEGAEYRGRGRMVNWDVAIDTGRAKIAKTAAINFWNPDNGVTVEDHRLSWKGITTGGFHAVDFWLEDHIPDSLSLTVNGQIFNLCPEDLAEKETVYEFGGLRKVVRISRLPCAALPAKLTETLEIPMAPNQERSIFLRINFEDGHVAWTSPVYIKRDSGE